MKAKKKIRLMFFGDLALVKDAGNSAEREHENIFSGIVDLFKGADLVIGNLEAPLPGDGRENLLKRPRVIADPTAFKSILNLGPDILCLANNHVYDALKDGYKKTIDFFKKNNIAYLGAGLSGVEASRPLIIEKNDFKVGVLNYVTEDTNPCLPGDCEMHLNFFNLKQVLEDLRKLKDKTDIRIVMLHWGIDYCHFPSPKQRDIVKALSRSGADVIVGTHAHVIQPVERIGSALIAYGLGNFYFPDFNFDNEKRVWAKENRESLVLDVVFKERGIDSVKYYRTIQKGNKIELHKQDVRSYIWKLRCISWFLKSNMIWGKYLFFRKGGNLIFRYFFRRDKNFVGQLLSIKPEHIRRLLLK